MKFAARPLWLVGFRPFFTLAALAGALLPIWWVLQLGQWLPAPKVPLTASQWHAHEMFYGFGWAVLGGFLLTSTKNWVNIRGYHGPALMLLAAAWIIERIAMAFGGSWPPLLFVLASNLFLGCIILMLLVTLIRHRDRDSYKDNVIFMVVLPAFLIAKNLLLSEAHFANGVGMTLDLFRMAFLVMLERTLTPFMKGGFQVDILRQPKLDMAIKLLGLLLVFDFGQFSGLTAGISLLLAALLLFRFFFWYPQLAFRRIDIGIMYVGYLAITGQLLIEALGSLFAISWVGTLSVHLFTFGAMGTVIPAMMMRIAKGHTGRKVVFDAIDRAVLKLMLGALVIRLLAPQLAPAHYLLWIQLAGTCWLIAFGTFALRYIPILMQARIDGKEH